MVRLYKDAFFYFALIFGVLILSVLYFNLFNIVKSTSNAPSYDFDTIVIDAGHGGEDSGAVADDGTLEKDINLDIANKLNEMLVSSGFHTLMTRKKDVAIYDKDQDENLRKKKVSDMQNRLELINSSHSNILISIHQNKFPDKKYSGTQVFFSKNHKLSEVLASSIQLSVKNLIQPQNDREIKPANRDIFILHNSKVPAMIVECGFISNDEELNKLNDEDYKSKIAFAIYCGILNSGLFKK